MILMTVDERCRLTPRHEWIPASACISDAGAALPDEVLGVISRDDREPGFPIAFILLRMGRVTLRESKDCQGAVLDDQELRPRAQHIVDQLQSDIIRQERMVRGCTLAESLVAARGMGFRVRENYAHRRR